MVNPDKALTLTTSSTDVTSQGTDGRKYSAPEVQFGKEPSPVSPCSPATGEDQRARSVEKQRNSLEDIDKLLSGIFDDDFIHSIPLPTFELLFRIYRSSDGNYCMNCALYFWQMIFNGFFYRFFTYSVKWELGLSSPGV